MKKFICPEVEFVKLSETDVIATSTFNLVDDESVGIGDIQARDLFEDWE